MSGSVWTKDLQRGAEIAARLEVGTAWVNQHRTTSAFVPFGGAKESGLGRQYSALGLEELHGARSRQRCEAVVCRRRALALVLQLAQIEDEIVRA